MIAGLDGPEIAWLAAVAFVAGLVRGFSGFGTAMVYLPFAGQLLGPFWAITTLAVMDLVGPLPNLPVAWRTAHRADIGRLCVGLVLLLPVGLWTLGQVGPEAFRYGVSGVTFVLLAALLLGLRYTGPLTRPAVYGTGGAAGFLMGVAGLPGPPVILVYMASALPAAVIRANTLIFLLASDVLLLPVLALFGRLEGGAIALGVLLMLPNLAGNVAGARAFRPGFERLYRGAAYLIIAGSALSGLPLWD